MSTVCPTCNHRNRKDANYCGFCGTNLTAVAESKPATQSSKAEKAVLSQNTTGRKQPKPKRFKTSQVVTTIAIVLLFLIIIVSVISRYWSEVSQVLVQLLFSVYLRFLML